VRERAVEMGSVGGGSPEHGQHAAAPVCVTGATGYVGSWLVRTLLRRGRRVHATARDPGTYPTRARAPRSIIASRRLM
jgi:NADP-dependent 3-hydroxy acid dehydrogenase YdfG